VEENLVGRLGMSILLGLASLLIVVFEESLSDREEWEVSIEHRILAGWERVRTLMNVGVTAAAVPSVVMVMTNRACRSDS
jgi:hypothetical protein